MGIHGPSDDDIDFDEDDEDEEDQLPPNCDQALYDQVLDLRERRLDQEDVLAEFQKTIDDLKKSYDRHSQRERQVDKELVATKTEINRFQGEKQQQLNQIEVSVCLTLSQLLIGYVPGLAADDDAIPDVEPGTLPDDATDALLFRRDELTRLSNRISELLQENEELAASSKVLQSQRRDMERDTKQLDRKVEEISAQAADLQMLKFGRLVDLDELDSVTEATGVDKIEATVAANEAQARAVLSELKQEMNQNQQQLLELTQESTVLLESIGKLTAKLTQIETDLNSNPKEGLVAADDPQARKEALERERLLELVKLQADRIDGIKHEIAMLRRKGGHVYNPPPAPQQSHT